MCAERQQGIRVTRDSSRTHQIGIVRMASASTSETAAASTGAASVAATPGTRRQQQRRAATLRPPADLGNGLEASVHLCSKALVAELQMVIPEKAELIQASGKGDQPSLVAVATAQRTSSDLAEWGDDAAKQKDDCLETVSPASWPNDAHCRLGMLMTSSSVSVVTLVLLELRRCLAQLQHPRPSTLVAQFAAWAAVVCSRLAEKGYWADFIDPCSGHPVSQPQWLDAVAPGRAGVPIWSGLLGCLRASGTRRCSHRAVALCSARWTAFKHCLDTR
jgi:hypothetical protein